MIDDACECCIVLQPTRASSMPVFAPSVLPRVHCCLYLQRAYLKTRCKFLVAPAGL
jgi:hypothetical protein